MNGILKKILSGGFHRKKKIKEGKKILMHWLPEKFKLFCFPPTCSLKKSSKKKNP